MFSSLFVSGLLGDWGVSWITCLITVTNLWRRCDRCSLRETMEVTGRLRNITAVWWNWNICDENSKEKRRDTTVRNGRTMVETQGVWTLLEASTSLTYALCRLVGEKLQCCTGLLLLIQSGPCSHQLWGRKNIVAQINVDSNKAETLLGAFLFVIFPC